MLSTRGSRRLQQEGERSLGHSERCHHVDLEGHAELVQRVVAQGWERRRAERAGVVDQEIEAAELGRGGHEVPAVRRIGDVTGQGTVGAPGGDERFEPSGGGLECRDIPPVDHH